MARNRPIRTCIGCRRKGAKTALVRFVSAPDGRITLDARQIMPGRGAYLCQDLTCLEKAWKRRAFVRALRIPPSRQGELNEDLRERLKREMEDFISLGEARPEEGDLHEQT